MPIASYGGIIYYRGCFVKADMMILTTKKRIIFPLSLCVMSFDFQSHSQCILDVNNITHTATAVCKSKIAGTPKTN
jgi:hypothetical protein